MGADGCDRGAHGRAGRRRGPARHGDGVRRARPGARARGAGRDVIHLEIGEPDFETPRARRRGGDRRDPGGRDALLPDGGPPGAARGGRRVAGAHRAASRSTPSASLVANGAKPFLFFTVLATCEPGRRGRSTPTRASRSTSRPCASSGATPVPLPLREERGFSFDPPSSRQLPERAHAARDPQRAAEPDRRRHRPRPISQRAAAAILADAGLGAHRRGLLADHLRRRRAVDRVACPGCSSAPSCSTASRRPSR